MALGEILEELRKDAGLTQKEVGALINVTGSTVGSYENNKALPPVTSLCILADKYNVSVDYMLERTRLRMSINDFQSVIKTEKRLIQIDKLIHEFEMLDLHGRDVAFEVLESLLQSQNLKRKK